MVFQSKCDKVFGTIEGLEAHKKDCKICSEPNRKPKCEAQIRDGCATKDGQSCYYLIVTGNCPQNKKLIK